MSKRTDDFLRILKNEKVLVFERIKKFLIDAENLAPFVSRISKPLLPTNELAIIVQFMAYGNNNVINPSNFTPLNQGEKDILHSCIYTKKSAEGSYYGSYIMPQDFIDSARAWKETIDELYELITKHNPIE